MRFWYHSELSPVAAMLLPLTWLTRWYTRRKRAQRNQNSYPVPVLVVGNVSVGGTGKTPMIIHLIRLLQQHGLKPGVVSRGYGATPDQPFPVAVAAHHSAAEVGDEPKLIAVKTGVPVIIDPLRHRAVQHLSANTEIDIIISDDGLQHYAMARDIEIVMVDGLRGFGNGRLLPAGPLREELKRLDDADFIFCKAQAVKLPVSKPVSVAQLIAGQPVNTAGKTLTETSVRVCSGIGNFDSFIASVQSLGLNILDQQQFRDHQPIPLAVLADESLPIVVTEKDYVKFSQPPEHLYYLPLELTLPDSAEAELIDLIREKVDEKSRHHTR